MTTSPEPSTGRAPPQAGDHSPRPAPPTGQVGRPPAHFIAAAVMGAATALLFILPLFWMVIISLRAVGLPPPRTIEWWPANPQWGNYVEIFRQVPMGSYLLNSLLVVAVSVPLTLLTASLGGFGLAQLRDERGCLPLRLFEYEPLDLLTHDRTHLRHLGGAARLDRQAV